MTRRVLVIEDNEQNLYLMRFLLEKNGCTVIGATDGPRGVAAVLRGHVALARVPIIAVTSHAMAGDRQRILAAGADGFIENPIDPATFVAEICRYLDE